MKLRNQQRIFILFFVLAGMMIAIQVKAKSGCEESGVALRSLKSINRRDGINQREALLIAQHCLFKSPFPSQYYSSKETLKISQEKNFYKVSFAPVSYVEDQCELSVEIDAISGDSRCFCQRGENLFSLKTAYVQTDDKQRIHYDHYENGKKEVVILIHGFYNSKEAVLFKRMAQDLSQDYDVIVMDMRGHGLSSGLFLWTAKSPQDLKAVLAYASQKYDHIGVIGFSLGAATSIIATAESPLVDSLISVSAPVSFSQIDGKFWSMGIEENIVYNVFGQGRIGKGVRPGFLWLKKRKPIDVVSQIAVPTLFVHGEKDWLINSRHSRDLFVAAQCPKALVLVEDGTHAEYLYRKDPQATMKLFKDWFNQTLKEE